MMMRFTKVTEDMREAMLQFCMEQSEMNGYTSEDEVMALVDSAFDVFDKASKTALPVVPVYRYHMYAGEQYTDEKQGVSPLQRQKARKKTVLCSIV